MTRPNWNWWKVKHGACETRLYGIWKQMRSRCRNPKQKGYANYGGKGIDVCAEWDSFSAFQSWALANGYADDLTIERLNNDVGYGPDNCTWIPRRDQALNQRKVHRSPDGTPWCVIAEQNGLSRKLFGDRVARGWKPDAAATTPKITQGPSPHQRPAKVDMSGQFCKSGHALTEDNAYWAPGKGRPQCRACNRIALAKYGRRRREQIRREREAAP